MKFGTFLIGGLAGAATVILLKNRNGSLGKVAGFVGQNVRQRMSGAKEQAIGQMLNMRFDGGRSESTSRSNRNENDSSQSSRSQGDSQSSRSQKDRAGGIDQIAQLASQDSEVKRQVNEILSQNGHNQI